MQVFTLFKEGTILMSKRLLAVIIAMTVLLFATIGFDVYKVHYIKKMTANFKFPAETVETVKTTAQPWQLMLYSVGTLKAVQSVDVSSEVLGSITQIRFSSGQEVQQGQSLVQLDDAFDQANLRNDIAGLNLAKADYDRQVTLLKQFATSKQALDQADAKLEQGKATVAADQVTISKKNILAPFSGKIGITKVNIGQYVQPGMALVSLQSIDPLYVDFYLPEQNIKDIAVGQTTRVWIRAYPSQAFYGKIVAINSTVDENTRNVLVRAEIPNKDKKLYPGIFANVDVILPTVQNVITVPQTAITYTLYGDSVYLLEVTSKNKEGRPIYVAKRQAVTLGEQRGDLVAILKGLQAGQEVVNAGQVKLQNGTEVIVNNKFLLKTGV